MQDLICLLLLFTLSSLCSCQGASYALVRAVGLNGLEPSTSRLSGVRSNLLSYKPVKQGLNPED